MLRKLESTGMKKKNLISTDAGGTMRIGQMPTIQLRMGDIIRENGRRWRVARIPVPQLLDCGRVLWHVAAELVDADPGDTYRSAGFSRYDGGEWLVEF